MKTHCVKIPTDRFLGFEDGRQLYAREIKHVEEEFLSGEARIAMLIPEGVSIFRDGKRLAYSDFFVALLNDLLSQYRDRYFPELCYRKNESQRREGVTLNTLKDSFMGPYQVYAPMEHDFLQKLSLGILHANGNYTWARLENEEVEGINDPRLVAQIAQWENSLWKGLGCMYMDNFDLSVIPVMEKDPAVRALLAELAKESS